MLSRRQVLAGGVLGLTLAACGSPASEKVNPRPPLMEISDGIDEWWTSPVAAHLQFPYERLVKTSYTSDGKIVVSEASRGTQTRTVTAAHPAWGVDDHNAAWLFAENGHRMVLGFARHGEHRELYLKVSDRDGSIDSLAYGETYELAMREFEFEHTNYGQCYRIRHMSTEGPDGQPIVDYFWLFTRSFDHWDVIEFTVDQGSGDVKLLNRLPLARAANLQLYCTSATDNWVNGRSEIRLGLAANPNSWFSGIWALTVDPVSRTIMLLDNERQAVRHPIDEGPLDLLTGSRALPVPCAVEPAGRETSRRLFAMRSGPKSPAILWSEWREDEPDSARYKVSEVVGTMWKTVDLGPAGPAFGYRADANYLAGGCFSEPCRDDFVYLARNTSPSVLERVSLGANVGTSHKLATSHAGTIVRPRFTPGASERLITYSSVSWYSDVDFKFESSSLSLG